MESNQITDVYCCFDPYNSKDCIIHALMINEDELVLMEFIRLDQVPL